MLLAGIYSVQMDSRLKTSGMTTITVIIYWDWYYITKLEINFHCAKPGKALNVFLH